ncbi:hypothetical protein MPSEU_000876200 [Mayamaea pseudoterrestris]|nr:hypothetical protein MPSEU_000876200 [Mayamaea pseudoterrestris]
MDMSSSVSVEHEEDNEKDYQESQSAICRLGTQADKQRTHSANAATTSPLCEKHLQQRIIKVSWPRVPQTPQGWNEFHDLSAILSASNASVLDAGELHGQDSPQQHLGAPYSPYPQGPRTNEIQSSAPEHQTSSCKLMISGYTSDEDENYISSALRKLTRVCRRLDVTLNETPQQGVLAAALLLSTLMTQHLCSKSALMEAYRIITTLSQHSMSFCQAALTDNFDFSPAATPPTVLDCILAGMKQFSDEENVQVHGTGALIMLLLRASEFQCQQFVFERSGSQVVISAMRTYLDSRDLQELGLILLAMVCEYTSLRVPVVKLGALRAADAALQRHSDDVPVVLLAQKAIVKFCQEKHLYDDDGNHLFRFYQEQIHGAAVASPDEKMNTIQL